jgi:hypothetical protein
MCRSECISAHRSYVESKSVQCFLPRNTQNWSLLQHHYGVNYSVCMCQSTASDLLKGVPPPNDMPQTGATHPSEHNAIYLLGKNISRHRQRAREQAESLRRSTIAQKTGAVSDIPEMHSAFLRKINGGSGYTDFGFLGLAGWAIDAEYDANCLDLKTPQMGNCCAVSHFEWRVKLHVAYFLDLLKRVQASLEARFVQAVTLTRRRRRTDDAAADTVQIHETSIENIWHNFVTSCFIQIMRTERNI